MTQPGRTESGRAQAMHAGTGPGHSPSRAQPNWEGIQANRDIAESGHSRTRRRHSRTEHGQSLSSPSDSGLTLFLDWEDPGLCLPRNPLPPSLDKSCGPLSCGGHFWNGEVGTPTAVPGIKAMKPPQLWGLVLGEAGVRSRHAVAQHGTVLRPGSWESGWLRAHGAGTDAVSGDGCSAKGQMLCWGMDSLRGDGCCVGDDALQGANALLGDRGPLEDGYCIQYGCCAGGWMLCQTTLACS